MALRDDVREVLSLGGVGVGELARQLINEVRTDDCFGHAAQLAYYFLFAFFPFLLFLTALLSFLPVPNLLERIMNLLAQVMSGETFSLIRNHVHTLVTQRRGGLLSFGVLVALWTASSAIVAVDSSLNRAYDVRDERPFWKARGLALLLTIGFSLFTITSLALLMFGPWLGGWIASAVGLGNVFQMVWDILRWPAIVFLLIITLDLLYYFAPNVEQRWKWITPGAVVAVIGWVLVSLGFSYFVNNFGSYNKAYGSIGAVIGLLTWMYLSGFLILVGGEINAMIGRAAQGKGLGHKKGRQAPSSHSHSS